MARTSNWKIGRTEFGDVQIGPIAALNDVNPVWLPEKGEIFRLGPWVGKYLGNIGKWQIMYVHYYARTF